MRQLFLTLFMLIGLQTQVAAKADAYKVAQAALAKGDLVLVEKSLRKLNKGHPQFKFVLAGLIKIYFKKNEFGKFFGNMYFYKSNYLTKYNLSKETFMPDLLALEALALNKLCRWKDALKIILKTKKLAKKLEMEIPTEVSQTEIFIVSSLRVNGFSRELSKTLKKLAPMTKDGYWKLNNTQLGKLDNPKNLRMNVRTKCKK